jgi:hypothetical protein
VPERCRWINPRVSANLKLNTRPAIALAFALGVHHPSVIETILGSDEHQNQFEGFTVNSGQLEKQNQ